MKILIISNNTRTINNFRKELIIDLVENNEVYVIAKNNEPLDDTIKDKIYYKNINIDEDNYNLLREIFSFIYILFYTIKIRPNLGIFYTIKPNFYGSIIFKILKINYISNIFGFGYLYLHKAPSATEFDRECKRLLNDIPFFDVLRSDKSISSNGLEPRTPFLDRKWVEFYLSISKDIRYHVGDGQCEKFLIRNAFYEVQPDLLPEEILWRTKEAFSDGVSSLTRSWFTIIQENIERLCDENPELAKTLEKIC